MEHYDSQNAQLFKKKGTQGVQKFEEVKGEARVWRCSCCRVLREAVMREGTYKASLT